LSSGKLAGEGGRCRDGRPKVRTSLMPAARLTLPDKRAEGKLNAPCAAEGVEVMLL
jgi:hypothetical protein